MKSNNSPQKSNNFPQKSYNFPVLANKQPDYLKKKNKNGIKEK